LVNCIVFAPDDEPIGSKRREILLLICDVIFVVSGDGKEIILL
jgi:hypothetical protein